MIKTIKTETKQSNQTKHNTTTTQSISQPLSPTLPPLDLSAQSIDYNFSRMSLSSKGGDNLGIRYHHPFKDRTQSEGGANSNPRIFHQGENTSPDGHLISSADIYSWKLKKEYDGTIYAVYCVHVSLKSGFKWIVERRYTQFRELRKEINKVRPDLENVPFPKKNWLFNLSKAALKSRQEMLNTYLNEIVTITPQLLEIGELAFVQIDLIVLLPLDSDLS
jgi:hypothetical protein